MKKVNEICGNVRVQWLVGIAVNLIFAILTLTLLSGCATGTPETPKRWAPHDNDPGLHLFYMSPISQDMVIDAQTIQAWNGDKRNQVEIFECSETEARVSDTTWISRSLLMADWCDAKIFERVK